MEVVQYVSDLSDEEVLEENKGEWVVEPVGSGPIPKPHS